MFQGMVNIALVNAFVVYVHNMRKQQTHMNLKRKEFLLSIARHLVTPFASCYTEVEIFYTVKKNPKSYNLELICTGFSQKHSAEY